MKDNILYRAKNGQPIRHKSCGMCEVVFEAYPTAKYCSDKCKQDAVDARDNGNKWVIFNRDGCRCVYCGITASESELRPDHIIPVVKGGFDTASNLVTSCAECNGGKHAKDLSEQTMQYVVDLVDKRNKDQGIPPKKVITGSHVRSRFK